MNICYTCRSQISPINSYKRLGRYFCQKCITNDRAFVENAYKLCYGYKKISPYSTRIAFKNDTLKPKSMGIELELEAKDKKSFDEILKIYEAHKDKELLLKLDSTLDLLGFELVTIPMTIEEWSSNSALISSIDRIMKLCNFYDYGGLHISIPQRFYTSDRLMTMQYLSVLLSEDFERFAERPMTPYCSSTPNIISISNDSLCKEHHSLLSFDDGLGRVEFRMFRTTTSIAKLFYILRFVSNFLDNIKNNEKIGDYYKLIYTPHESAMRIAREIFFTSMEGIKWSEKIDMNSKSTDLQSKPEPLINSSKKNIRSYVRSILGMR